MPESRIKVVLIDNESDLKLAQQIRYEVFVEGQGVPAEEEIDRFEVESRHFLALMDGEACGAARWRITEKGVKLERFAVLEHLRGMGVGSALVRAVLDDISVQPDTNGKPLYLHSQISAVPLYKKFGFRCFGDLFQECDIDHYLMKK
jgi:predicted GNAT family N-acyltransferase